MKEFTLIFALVAIVFSCQKKEIIVLDKGFCKLVKRGVLYTTEGSHETIQVTYSWEGNTRISEYGEVVEHNDFGKVLRISHAGGNGGVLAYEYAGCE